MLIDTVHFCLLNFLTNDITAAFGKSKHNPYRIEFRCSDLLTEANIVLLSNRFGIDYIICGLPLLIEQNFLDIHLCIDKIGEHRDYAVPETSAGGSLYNVAYK